MNNLLIGFGINMAVAVVCVVNDKAFAGAIAAFGAGHLLRWIFEEWARRSVNAHR